MPAFFDNKTIFLKKSDEVKLSIKIVAQPAITTIYLDGIKQKQFKGNGEYTAGDGNLLKGKKIRIHTTVQDKNDNTDDIKVEHLISYGTNNVSRVVNTTASEEGDIFDVFTDIKAF